MFQNMVNFISVLEKYVLLDIDDLNLKSELEKLISATYDLIILKELDEEDEQLFSFNFQDVENWK